MPRLLLAVLAAAAFAGLAGCSTLQGAAAPAPLPAGKPGRLLVPKTAPSILLDLPPGVHKLATENGSGFLYVPADQLGPRPLLVVFHGAGGKARDMIDLLSAAADEQGVLLLAPQSSGHTWDLVTGEYGQDALVLQQLLSAVSMMVPMDPAHVGLGGFSDGASYALSLGLDNGDVISSVLAFSPGFTASEHPVGAPRVFVSHGTADQVLNVNACGRAIVNKLRELGYGVTYREFEGQHTVPKEIAGAAAKWFAGG